MKSSSCWLVVISLFLGCSSARSQSLQQTFEAGEDTSNWGSTFTGGQTTSGFLDPSLGGLSAGGGGSLTQSFSRSFRDNTIGLDVSSPYSISLYIQLDTFDGPAGGQFQIVDGAFGTGNAANLQVATEEVSPGNFVFHWQARDNNTGWHDLGVDLTLGDPYRILLNVDPTTFTYSATVESVDPLGNVLSSGSLANLAFDQNVINNHQNGDLLFYVQASAGGADARVDNINIVGTPEPGSALLMGVVFGVFLCRRNRATGHLAACS